MEDSPLLSTLSEMRCEGGLLLCCALQQARGIAAFDLERLQVFALGLTELAKVQIPRLLMDLAKEEVRLEEGEAGISGGEANGAVALALQPAIEAICELPRALLQHPSYEVKEVGVVFYRNLLNHVVVLVEEERRLSAWRDHLRNEAAVVAAGAAGGSAGSAAAQAAGVRKDSAEVLAEVESRYELSIEVLALQEPVLSRIFQPFAVAAVPQLRPPVGALLNEELEFEAWQSFRAEVAATVTEAAVLLDIDRPCNESAGQLLMLLSDPEVGWRGFSAKPALSGCLSPCFLGCVCLLLFDWSALCGRVCSCLLVEPLICAWGLLVPQICTHPEALLEVEARLYFISAIANRIRLNVPFGGTEGESSSNSANSASSSAESRNDDFLLHLLQLLPQLAGLAPSSAASVPVVGITEREALTLFLLAGAARATSWLAGRVLPQHQELFAPLFSLLLTRALQFVASLPVRLISPPLRDCLLYSSVPVPLYPENTLHASSLHQCFVGVHHGA